LAQIAEMPTRLITFHRSQAIGDSLTTSAVYTTLSGKISFFYETEEMMKKKVFFLDIFSVSVV